jgi:hypothetical protein
MRTEDEPDGKGGKRSRLEAAKEKALNFVDALREPGLVDRDAGSVAMVIAFDSTAEVRETFTGDKVRLRNAIRSIQATDAPTRVEEAVRLARANAPKRIMEFDPKTGEQFSPEGLTASFPLTMHLYSDGQLPDKSKAKPGPEDTIIFNRLGDPKTGNVGIVALRADRAYDNPDKLTIFVGVQSTDVVPRTCDVEFVIEGFTAGISQVSLPAARVVTPTGATAPDAAPATPPAPGNTPPPDAAAPATSIEPATGGVKFDLQRTEGAVVQVRLRTTSGSAEIDAFALDDRAWLVVPPARRLSVACVTKGSYFLTSALAALPLAKLETLTPEQFSQKLAAQQTDQYDVVVLDGWTPPVKPGEPPLPPGRFLVLGAIPGGDIPAPEAPPTAGPILSGPVLIDRGKAGATSIIDWSRDHPALRAVNLDALVIVESRLVEIPRGSPALVAASAETGPAIIDLALKDSRALVVAFNPGDSNWPFDVSFIVFLASGMDYLAGDAGAQIGRMLRPGDVLSDRLPAGTSAATIIPPDNARTKLNTGSDGGYVYGPIPAVGVYRVNWSGAQGPSDLKTDDGVSRWFTANLLDPAESNVAAAEKLSLATQEVRATQATDAARARRYWPWFLLAALGVLMLEWFVYNRKVHV